MIQVLLQARRGSPLTRNRSLALIASLTLSVGNVTPQDSGSGPPAEPARELAGLWETKRRFGPDIGGTLLITRRSGRWQAEIAGQTVPAKLAEDSITFELPDGEGKFQGKPGGEGATIRGHWTQATHFSCPVHLTKYGHETWRGIVSPLDDTLTFYMMVKVSRDGSVSAFIRNPERNAGATQYPVARLERHGESVRLFAANKGPEKGGELAVGRYDTRQKLLSLSFRDSRNQFDFRPVKAHAVSDFYPRGRANVPYVYRSPHRFEDGWRTASLEDVGISRAGIEKFVQMIIDTPMDSAASPEVHGVLIARHGKLVLEEYFHGESREKPHDMRSAAKSLTSTLIGAAITAGLPLQVSSPVYEIMNGGNFPPDLDPRKRTLTLEHLLTMSSGLDCNDGDPNSPRREDAMVDENGEPDYYMFTMALNLIRNPGEKVAYCTGGANLAGGVLQRASGRSLPELMQDLLAQPLEIKRYYFGITPAGDT